MDGHYKIDRIRPGEHLADGTSLIERDSKIMEGPTFWDEHKGLSNTYILSVVREHPDFYIEFVSHYRIITRLMFLYGAIYDRNVKPISQEEIKRELQKWREYVPKI